MEIIDFLSKYNSFAIFCHENPDADAVGSLCSLKAGLESIGKTCYAFCDGDLAQNLEYLGAKIDLDENLINKAEAMILVDCNSPHRTGKFEKYFDQTKPVAIIDHHPQGEYKPDCEHIISNSPSTCDIMFDLFNKMNIEISPYMANLLYAGLSSDTGGFIHPSTSSLSHLHASALIEKGIDLTQANFNLFKFKPKGYFNFLKYYLKHTKSYFDGKLLISVVKNASYKKFKENIENCAFDFMQGIDGNEITIRLTEKEKGKFNISFRSNKYANVGAVAQKFNGGGHFRASGGSSSQRLHALLKALVLASKEELDKCKE